MSEVPIELLIGLIFLVVVFLVPYLPQKKITLSFKKPNLILSKKEREKKLEEIDKKLEEVLSEPGKEKIVKLDEATEEAAKKFEIKGDLLSEMQTTEKPNQNTESVEQKSEELSLPGIEKLEDLGEVEKNITLEQNEQKETKIEFEESDKLLEDLAKEVEKKKEEKLDLLRELKGQKFEVGELEYELKEVLERVKRLKT
ncbi:MAG: hypothetical protein NZ872_01895 [Archaeoglobaceae archaeon]|nr:hypothetical protein [Archaeoglobaceae archaeon]MDW8127950.1 hypothetical protein [Archaeoglobaceae archaeon]